MKVIFDRLPPGHVFPLSKKQIVMAIDDACAQEAVARNDIRMVRWGCNERTTQEASIIQRGDQYDIRVNLTILDGCTRVVAVLPRWLGQIKTFGGEIDFAANRVKWRPGGVHRYARFLLYHEIAHIVFNRRLGRRGMVVTRNSYVEERFCDEWARSRLLK